MVVRRVIHKNNGITSAGKFFKGGIMAFFRSMILICGAMLGLAGAAWAEGGSLQPREQVWTEDGREGYIDGIFPDGRVSVRINYANVTFYQDELARRGCFRQLCSSDEVITSDGQRGEVNGFFPRGWLSVRVGYSNLSYAYRDLAPANPSPPPPPHNGPAFNEVVWTPTGVEGRVAGFYGNGDVDVQVGYTVYRYALFELARKGCVANLCTGQAVRIPNGSRGFINGFFPNSDAIVDLGYTNARFSYYELSPTYP